MFVEYFYWHYVVSPLWLIRFFVTLQQAILQYFSVTFMLRTLVSPWRKDQVSYRGGLGGIAIVFAWNMISRGIGFVIRCAVISLWLIVEVLFLLLAGLFFLLFMAWPLLSLFAVALGLGLLLNSL